MDSALVFLILVVMLGLAFEFVNGFHDAANAIATVVATRVLPPMTAVMLAGVLNFIGAISGTAVAATIGKGLVDPGAVTQVTIMTALLAAIIWDLATWYYGLPTSSSHALVFAVLGAAVATKGFDVVILSGIEKVSFGIIYSPLIALFTAGPLMVGLYWLVHRLHPTTVSAIFGRLQLFSSAYMAFSHGSNDGQKTMGIISLALFTYGSLGPTFYVPLWVIVTAAIALALGTTAGGWRIIRTMGQRLTRLEPIHGFAAETAAGTIIEIATRIGMPISTTHAISGAIMGVGSVRNLRSVRWGIAGNIATAWLLTLPSCFVMGWLLMRMAIALHVGD